MTITEEICDLVVRTAKSIAQGAPRGDFVADTIRSLDLGQCEAQTLFGWGRDTIRKALQAWRTRRGGGPGSARRASVPARRR